MLKKDITYTDFNGVERKETFWFHLSKAELLDMEMTTTGGYAEMVQRIVDAKDAPALIHIFKDLIRKSYGIKSEDGRRFIKSDELFEEFSQTEAYSQLYMELTLNADKAAEFANGIMPQDLEADLKKFVPAATAPTAI